ncbi:MAG: hypothetical protein OIF32_12170, partial [Campylobacterales bacterium]|nr:hypothetical protein [Campylobacterales bacterium]
GDSKTAIKKLVADDMIFSDKMDAYTYLGINRLNPGLALFYLNEGDKVNALDITNKAKVLLDDYFNSKKATTEILRGKNYVTYGYSKLGYLYGKAGDLVKAKEVFEKAIAIADGSYDGGNTDYVLGQEDDRVIQTEALLEIATNQGEVGLLDESKQTIEKLQKIIQQTNNNKDKISNLSSINYNIMEDGILSKKHLDYFYETVENNIKLIYPNITKESISISEKNKITILINSSRYIFVTTKNKTESYKYLKEASKMVTNIKEPAVKNEKLSSLIGIYVDVLDDIDKGIEISNTFSKSADRMSGIKTVAVYASNYDKFRDSDLAIVDTDNDGKPDFFSYGVTEQQIANSELILDDDSDGDGILDSEDLTPFFYKK